MHTDDYDLDYTVLMKYFDSKNQDEQIKITVDFQNDFIPSNGYDDDGNIKWPEHCKLGTDPYDLGAWIPTVIHRTPYIPSTVAEHVDFMVAN